GAVDGVAVGGGAAGGSAATANQAAPEGSARMTKSTRIRWWIRMPRPPNGLDSALFTQRVESESPRRANRVREIPVDTLSHSSYFAANVRTEARRRVPLAPRRGNGTG